MITKVQTLRHAINAERKAAAIKEGRNPEDDKVPQCEHLWVVSGVSGCHHKLGSCSHAGHDAAGTRAIG